MSTTTSIEISNSPIDKDLLCINCDYNLRTLTPNNNCPECGHPALKTLQQPRLCDAPTHYLKRLRSVLTTIIIVSIASYSLNVLAISLYLSGTVNYPLLNGLFYYTLNILHLPLVIILTISIFRLSSTNSHTTIPKSTARSIRIIAAFYLLFAFPQHIFNSHTLELSSVITLTTISFFYNLFTYFTYIYLFRYASQFTLGSRPDTHHKPLKLISHILFFTILILIPAHQTVMMLYFLAAAQSPPAPGSLLYSLHTFFSYAHTITDIFLIGLALIYLLKLRFNLTHLIKQKSIPTL
ncbi:hypothetical protein KS4_33980 [Poriferisphaera corsica]|uniref:Uncharacterized protein n=1 Tax=Poriferisphaera corsica TaxID=2528020 RepID=A0A517YYN4_9BACT|nr:hypothetical protein [Poriferisphaera corsica]QDU35317.1 hypothetical protein KS4_33980 [Poriferisphaera corsica]